jgi:anaerobic magnesium-protoporphyrin IX monomethyl ester cyclase
MRVVFLGIGAEQMSVEILGGILEREGHEVHLAFTPALFDDRYNLSIPSLARFFDEDAAVIERAVALRPDVIAMSVLTNTYRWGLRIAGAVRARTGAKVIFGGVHPSAVPDVVLAEPVVDAVCVGEGDRAFPDWLRALAEGDPERPVVNLRSKRADGSIVRGPTAPFEQDLDSLPFPDKRLYEEHFAIRDMYMTITGRGCAYQCTFCFNNFWARLPARDGVRGGKYVRQRSVDNVIAELLYAKKRWGIRFIDFEDDIFTIDKAWIRAFLDRYKREIRLPWMCLSHVKYVDQDIIDWMAESGCTWVQIGIQSVDEHYKYKVMKRYEKTGDTAWAIDAFRRAGIGVKGDHIFGSSGEGPEAQEAARLFYAKHTPSRIGTFWMTYFPGVEITQQALQRGDLTQDAVDRINRGELGSYHGVGGVDPGDARRLASYEALFQMMPLLPQTWRAKVRPEWFDGLPLPALKGLAQTADIARGMVSANPDHFTYASHYLRHIARHVRARLQ